MEGRGTLNLSCYISLVPASSLIRVFAKRSSWQKAKALIRLRGCIGRYESLSRGHDKLYLSLSLGTVIVIQLIETVD